MGRYDALRERLPSLWRPDAGDAAEPLVPLSPEDVTGVLGDGPIPHAVRDRGDGVLVVHLHAPEPVTRVRLAAGRAPGSGWALVVHRVGEDGAFVPQPLTVAEVRDGVATLGEPVAGPRLGLLLKRRSLVPLALLAVAEGLDRINEAASEVMQTHWFGFADSARYSRFFLRGRELETPPAPFPGPRDPDVLDFPYILDLGRLASLLSLPPWQIATAGDPGETVEEYRMRIARVVALYTDGLATVEALRRMTEAQLPVDLDAPPERRDRAFTIEEFAPLAPEHLAVHTGGKPDDLVGPLMHWRVDNDGVDAAALTVYVQSPDKQERLGSDRNGGTAIEDTRAPAIERFDPAALEPAVALGYTGTVPPGRTLRLRAAHASWLGTDDGVLVARAGPGAVAPDPSAPGPWEAAEDAPKGPVTAVLQTSDLALWVAVAHDGDGQLWRHDGTAWVMAIEQAGHFACLAEDGADLLIGGDEGLLRMDRFPAGGKPFEATASAGVGDRPVRALLRGADGAWWVGTATGLGRLEGSDAFAPFVLTGDLKVDVRALAEDGSGALYVGGDLGLLQFQPSTGRWYWYSGESASDDDPEWQELLPAEPAATRNAPVPARVFLPPVTCVRRTRDGTLWIGTAAGPARYIARGERGPAAFRTRLEAFPDLVAGRVGAIAEDERGRVWLSTARGLLRYDGRDVFQYRDDDGWVQLGRADSLYDGPEPRDRGAWRYRRDPGEWQRFDAEAAAPAWVAFATAPRTTAEPAVHALAFTDAVAADLVDWDAAAFTASGAEHPVDPAEIVVRYKPPGYERIVDGGIPALPRLPAGRSSWRYLSLEPEGLELPKRLPAWTLEGRLVRNGTGPPDAEPDPGRFDAVAPDPDAGLFGEAIFSFPPAARVGFEWAPRAPLSVLARLEDETDPAVLDRVWRGLQQVRPAGVRAALAVASSIVRKET